MKLTETDKKRLLNGEKACILIPPEYFEAGDYSTWQDNTEETSDMTYDEFQEWLVEDMREYDSIILYSDGTIYGNKGGISYDIDYDNFGRDIEKFIELVENYGIGELDWR